MMYHHLSVILDGCEVDEMPCRKGVWKFDTLWEHPLGKGEATCHSSWLYSFMHRRYVEGYYKSSSLTHDANGREHSTGATHFEEMMIPLFVMMRKNFVVTKLGWAVVSVTCFSPYAKISTKNKRENLSILN